MISGVGRSSSSNTTSAVDNRPHCFKLFGKFTGRRPQARNVRQNFRSDISDVGCMVMDVDPRLSKASYSKSQDSHHSAAWSPLSGKDEARTLFRRSADSRRGAFVDGLTCQSHDFKKLNHLNHPEMLRLILDIYRPRLLGNL